jgi:hypothetical protein
VTALLQMTRVMLPHNDCRGETATLSYVIISNDNCEVGCSA